MGEFETPRDPGADSSALPKAVLHRRDGTLVRGFLRTKPDAQGKLRLITQAGEELTPDPTTLKAVFLVRDFDGLPSRSELQFLKKKKPADAVWVRIEFYDGEVMEGRVDFDLNALNEPGFYLALSDTQANNLGVYVYKSALRRFELLAAD